MWNRGRDCSTTCGPAGKPSSTATARKCKRLQSHPVKHGKNARKPGKNRVFLPVQHEYLGQFRFGYPFGEIAGRYPHHLGTINGGNQRVRQMTAAKHFHYVPTRIHMRYALCPMQRYVLGWSFFVQQLPVPARKFEHRLEIIVFVHEAKGETRTPRP